MRVSEAHSKAMMESQRRRVEADEEKQGKTILVGIKMDLQSKELLTWSLVNIAAAGDCVIALHVLPSSADATDQDGSSPSSLLCLVKAFDSVLAVYEGFCNLKQIDLKMKVCRGSSVRKVLVREACACAAAKLIVGVNKNGRTIGYSSTSVAKYCARKLPRDSAVIAVNNGKVVFQREASPSSSKAIVPVNSDDQGQAACFMALARQASTKHMRKFNGNAENKKRSVQKTTRLQNNSICREESTKDDSLAIVPVDKADTNSTSIRHLHTVRSGWPLLRKYFINSRGTISEKSKISAGKSKHSLVPWAMRLPNPNLSTVHPDLRIANESMAIVPVDSDVSCSSVKLCEEERRIPEDLVYLQEKYSSVCRLFTYKELMQATLNFSPGNLIGKGGNSRVYKGSLSDGKELAVKLLKSTGDVVQEFVREIEIITSLNHKNIVSLFGFCFENNNLLLVYDFLSRGSLEENLHGLQEKKNHLTWTGRLKVAVGIAEALDYLHSRESGPPVIHRDVKSSNILLLEDFEPQLCDFGLAGWATSDSRVTCSDVAGTFGYLAPEYFMYGKVTEKIDVYAFGVVLLELITGKKAITDGSKGQESLVLWAKQILQGGKIAELIDPCLGGNYYHDEMERMVFAASLCIRRAPRARPQISYVLKLLQGDENALKWTKSQANVSEELDGFDDEALCPDSNIQLHINLALLDIEDDSLSISSAEPIVDSITANTSLVEYLKGRCSSSSSFD